VRKLPAAIVTNEAVMAETFAQRGFDETRIEDLAEATGVPKATLYYHFGGKDEILAWLLRSMLSALGEAVTEAALGRGSARRRLEAVVRAQLGVMAERPASCRILIADLGRAARMPDLAEAVGRAFHGPVLRLLADGATDGSWRKLKDPTILASAIFGAVVLPALDTLINGERLDPDQVAPPILRFIFTGLIGR
jgi:AcrR family transcriptional regulator